MNKTINYQNLIPINELKGDSDEDTKLLKQLANRAEEYIKSFNWCPEIAEKYFGIGIGKIIAVFLFHFKKKINDIDEWLWVINGDLPSAYLEYDSEITPTPKNALEIYCELMEEWYEAVLNDKSLDNVFPVRAPVDKEHAIMLKNRIKSLRDYIIPQFE